jgi:hypothetical protein
MLTVSAFDARSRQCVPVACFLDWLFCISEAQQSCWHNPQISKAPKQSQFTYGKPKIILAAKFTLNRTAAGSNTKDRQSRRAGVVQMSLSREKLRASAPRRTSSKFLTQRARFTETALAAVNDKIEIRTASQTTAERTEHTPGASRVRFYLSGSGE